MSALEHAIPERFFNNPNQCNATGTTTPIAGLPTCPQGISAVKALGLAAQAGQKIYTITAQVYQDNPNIVNNQLFAHSQSTKDRIQQALDAGYEITIHEAPITQDGWTGAGFSVIDPNTGAGGYLIEGGANGGWLPTGSQGALGAGIGLGLSTGALAVLLPFVYGNPALLLGVTLMAIAVISLFILNLNIYSADTGCVWQGFGLGMAIVGLLGLFKQIIDTTVSAIGGLIITNMTAFVQGTLSTILSSFIGGGASAFAASNTLPHCWSGTQ